MYIAEGLTFDDVLLVPKYSDLSSRSEVNLSVKLNKEFEFKLPVIPSNMKTISELAMIKLMFSYQALGVFHRFTDIKTQLDYYNVQKLVDNGAEVLVIDIAHGSSEHCVRMTEFISSTYPEVLLISGNIAEGDGAYRLWKAGADVVKCGIGQGSCCLTRINTGCGSPSLTSINSCYEKKLPTENYLKRKLFLMQDGGLHSPGCISKALCFADLCMIGGLFAGTDEAAAKIVDINGKQYKSYVGSSTHRGSYTEGVEGLKKYKGSAHKVIREIEEGIRSCASYQGVRNLEDLKKSPKFIKISSAGIRESGAHDMDIIK
jgi:IMP dehydrogenase